SAAPTFTDFSVQVAPYFDPPTATQKGGGSSSRIKTNDARILNAEWRNNRLVAVHTVGISADSEAHVRWYEFNTAGSAPTRTQQGTLDPGGTTQAIHTYFPAIAIAANGDLGLTYMQSS